MSERIIKEEEVKGGKGVTGKGTLTLTDNRLSFSTKRSAFTPVFRQQRKVEVSLGNIVNVRIKKAFAAGQDHLEIDYVVDGRRKRLLFTRFSLAQWASTASSLGRGGALGRLEANSFSSWEQAINDARLHPTSEHRGSPEVDDLERLAALKQKGILTEDEFQRKKRQILGLGVPDDSSDALPYEEEGDGLSYSLGGSIISALSSYVEWVGTLPLVGKVLAIGVPVFLVGLAIEVATSHILIILVAVAIVAITAGGAWWIVRER